jgi:hypothetical protein
MQVKSENSSVSPSLGLSPRHDLRIRFDGWRGLERRLSQWLWHLPDAMRIARNSLDSLRGHIRIRLAKGRPPMVDFGPGFRRRLNGSYQVDTRTLSRSEHTKELLAMHPWADSVDLEMFLMGFDAGEQWAACKWSTGTYTAPDKCAWLLRADANFRQAIKLSNVQTSDVTPAAIAGVTRNV